MTDKPIVFHTSEMRGQMPKKPWRKHRWIATAIYTVAEESIRNAINDPSGSPQMLDHENMVEVMVGCLDCEEPVSVSLLNRPCNAPAFNWNGAR